MLRARLWQRCQGCAQGRSRQPLQRRDAEGARRSSTAAHRSLKKAKEPATDFAVGAQDTATLTEALYSSSECGVRNRKGACVCVCFFFFFFEPSGLFRQPGGWVLRQFLTASL